MNWKVSVGMLGFCLLLSVVVAEDENERDKRTISTIFNGVSGFFGLMPRASSLASAMPASMGSSVNQQAQSAPAQMLPPPAPKKQKKPVSMPAPQNPFSFFGFSNSANNANNANDPNIAPDFDVRAAPEASAAPDMQMPDMQMPDMPAQPVDMPTAQPAAQQQNVFRFGPIQIPLPNIGAVLNPPKQQATTVPPPPPPPTTKKPVKETPKAEGPEKFVLSRFSIEDLEKAQNPYKNVDFFAGKNKPNKGKVVIDLEELNKYLIQHKPQEVSESRPFKNQLIDEEEPLPVRFNPKFQQEKEKDEIFEIDPKLFAQYFQKPEEPEQPNKFDPKLFAEYFQKPQSEPKFAKYFQKPESEPKHFAEHSHKYEPEPEKFDPKLLAKYFQKPEESEQPIKYDPKVFAEYAIKFDPEFAKYFEKPQPEIELPEQFDPKHFAEHYNKHAEEHPGKYKYEPTEYAPAAPKAEPKKHDNQYEIVWVHPDKIQEAAPDLDIRHFDGHHQKHAEPATDPKHYEFVYPKHQAPEPAKYNPGHHQPHQSHTKSEVSHALQEKYQPEQQHYYPVPPRSDGGAQSVVRMHTHDQDIVTYHDQRFHSAVHAPHFDYGVKYYH